MLNSSSAVEVSMAGYYSQNRSPYILGSPFSPSSDVRDGHGLSKYGSYNTKIPPTGFSHNPGTLPRTISSANLELTDQWKDTVKRDLVRDAPRGATTFFSNTPKFTITIPSLDHQASFKSYVLGVLVDSSVQKLLEGEYIINWCDSVTRVVPLNTIRDGNCLLHAASLGMWGFQDRNYTLRNALHDALECPTENTLYNRWRQSREVENDRVGLQLTPDLWEKEWQCVKRQATTDVVIGQNLDGLDDFHVFVLANVLRRPIIMYASSKYTSIHGDGSLQELNFAGVYLPLLWLSSMCKKSPLPLTYCNGHFSALTVVKSPDQYKNGQLVLPLVDCHSRHLPIKFTMVMEDKSELCMEYLNLIQKKIDENSPAIICSKLAIPDASDNSMMSLDFAFIRSCADAFEQENSIRHSWESKPSSHYRGDGLGAGYQDERREDIREGMHYCRSKCGNNGEAKYSYFCFQCYQDRELGSSHSRHGPRSETQPHLRPCSPPKTGNQILLDLDNGHRLISSTANEVGNDRGGRGTLKCSECSEPGYPQFLGRCRRCYNRTQFANADTIYETLPSVGCASPAIEQPPSVPLPRNPKERTLCRRKGCSFFGTEENRFYCSMCFEGNLANILKEADHGPPISPVYSTIVHANPIEKGQSVSSLASNPPKCSNCYEYFASMEYNGLCHTCFMKSTLPSGGSSSESSGVSRTAFTEPHHSNRGGMGKEVQERRRSYDKPMYATQPAHVQQQSLFSDKEGRLPNMTAPIHNVSSQLQAMSLQTECIICNGNHDLHGSQTEKFVLCRRHAIEAVRSSCGGRRGDELPATATVNQRGESNYYHVNDPSNQRQTYNAFHEDGNNRSLEYRRSSTERERSSSEQWRRNIPEQGSIRNTFSYHPGGGEHCQYVQSENYAQQFDNNQRQHSHRPKDPQHDLQAYHDGSNPRERGRLPIDDRPNDGGCDGAGMISDGAAVVRSGGGDDVMVEAKVLCVQPGCSCIPYKELKGNCPDCYEDVFKEPVDRDKFPLL